VVSLSRGAPRLGAAGRVLLRRGLAGVHGVSGRTGGGGLVQWEHWFTCTDAVGREAKGMIAIREGALVVVAPPGGSISFTTEQLDQAEEYGKALGFGLEMLHRQARAKRGKRPRGRGRGGS